MAALGIYRGLAAAPGELPIWGTLFAITATASVMLLRSVRPGFSRAMTRPYVVPGFSRAMTRPYVVPGFSRATPYSPPATCCSLPSMIRVLAFVIGLLLPAPTWAQAPQAKPADPPGKEILSRKCFQCHSISMWTSLRQDRKQWEAVLYRMVGRGALWTEAEVTAMADYLAQLRGPK